MLMQLRKQRSLLCALLFSTFLFASEPIGAQELTLDQVLSRMEAAGDRLKTLRAEVEQKKWTEILQEYDAGESGLFLFLKGEHGVYLRKQIQQPYENLLVIREGEVIFYQPGIKQAQKYQLGRHKDKAEFMLLGFGSDKESLHQSYNIQLQGRGKLGERQAYQLELTPKSEKVSAFFSRIVLWIDPQLWIPVQQKLVEPTQDHLLIRFSKIEWNPRISKSDFEVKLPKDVAIIGN